MDDRSWMHVDRRSLAYELGVASFLKFAIENGKDCNNIPCPCCKCWNMDDFPISAIKTQIYYNGVDESYKIWKWHGEKVDTTLSSSEDVDSCSIESDSVDGNVGADYTVEMDRSDDDDEFSSECNEFKEFVEDANKPLYPSCTRFTKLGVLVKFYNLKAKHGMSNAAYSDWLIAFGEHLPEGNEIPTSIYEAKKTLGALGMDYRKMHACPNDCILYRKQYIDDTHCPTCEVCRWKVGKNSKAREGVSSKVLWYFPPIPRFQRMFQSTKTASSLTWHSTDRPKDGLLRHPADALTWKSVDEKWPDFGSEARNLRLALSSDGFNPHSSLNSKYSCWPVILVNYNLPRLCMKRKYMMLTLLISGPKQPGNDIDVYLEPLIDDLKVLWEGVQ
ncbi:uncharacterized protein LOC112178122 [Rosa chinensis]|uniref:uncharacterized protein LOC112178122 n=1 Tax=Rosa chinensis TaxID=74649 RepID=UPI000D08A79D|nr:uncharacterized protein LOC112178122 [Rosa chinensis]